MWPILNRSCDVPPSETPPPAEGGRKPNTMNLSPLQRQVFVCRSQHVKSNHGNKPGAKRLYLTKLWKVTKLNKLLKLQHKPVCDEDVSWWVNIIIHKFRIFGSEFSLCTDGNINNLLTCRLGCCCLRLQVVRKNIQCKSLNKPSVSLLAVALDRSSWKKNNMLIYASAKMKITELNTLW